jgi:hypothetical protein
MKLTKSEEQLMEIIWQQEKVFMKDILNEYPDPKPAGTTIAKGEVPLHRVLSKSGYEEKFTDDEMEDKIEEALKVVFLKADDSVIDPASVAGCYTVEVESAELIPNVKITELPKDGKSNKRRIIPDVLHTYPDVLGGSRKRASRRRI